MKKTTCLPTLLIGINFLLYSVHCFSQRDTSYYFFDNEFKFSGDASSIHAGIAIRNDSIWHLTIVNTSTQKIVMTGYYLAADLQKKDGPFDYYFDDGKPRQRGYYHEGVKAGLWKSWNHEGRLTDSVVFDSGVAKITSYYVYDETDHLLNYTYNDGQKKIFMEYYPDGVIRNETYFEGKAGHANEYYADGKLSAVATFDETGKKISQKHFNAEGAEVSEIEYEKEVEKITKKMQAELTTMQPEFKGGNSQFELFVQRSLRLPFNFSRSYPNIESIQFSFVLNEKGRAEKLILISPVNVELKRSLRDLLDVMPPWDMKGLDSYGPINQTITIKSR